MPHIEFRKIIKIGESSFGVILPKSWLRYFDLDHGDKVEVISNSDVVIRPTKKPRKHHEIHTNNISGDYDGNG